MKILAHKVNLLAEHQPVDLIEFEPGDRVRVVRHFDDLTADEQCEYVAGWSHCMDQCVDDGVVYTVVEVEYPSARVSRVLGVRLNTTANAHLDMTMPDHDYWFPHHSLEPA